MDEALTRDIRTILEGYYDVRSQHPDTEMSESLREYLKDGLLGLPNPESFVKEDERRMLFFRSVRQANSFADRYLNPNDSEVTLDETSVIISGEQFDREVTAARVIRASQPFLTAEWFIRSTNAGQFNAETQKAQQMPKEDVIRLRETAGNANREMLRIIYDRFLRNVPASELSHAFDEAQQTLRSISTIMREAAQRLTPVKTINERNWYDNFEAPVLYELQGIASLRQSLSRDPDILDSLVVITSPVQDQIEATDAIAYILRKDGTKQQIRYQLKHYSVTMRDGVPQIYKKGKLYTLHSVFENSIDITIDPLYETFQARDAGSRELLPLSYRDFREHLTQTNQNKTHEELAHATIKDAEDEKVHVFGEQKEKWSSIGQYLEGWFIIVDKK